MNRIFLPASREYIPANNQYYICRHMESLLFINWDPDPVAISLGFWNIKWYGLMWSLSILLSFLMGLWMCRREQKDAAKLTDMIIYIFVFALIGSRLMQVVYYQPAYFWKHPAEIPMVWNGGLASHGGAIGVFFGILFFVKRNPEWNFLFILDRASVIGFISIVLIRLGNLFNSELVGKPTDLDWGFIFRQVDNVPRHPSVLYETIAYFFIFLLQVFLYVRYLKQQPGLTLSVFFSAPFIVRFFIEFTKEPEVIYFGGLSNTQVLHFPFMAIGAVLWWLTLSGKLKKFA
jgi:phosphatidylglycerol:prolipoprotein diacylglycerol transferase